MQCLQENLHNSHEFTAALQECSSQKQCQSLPVSVLFIYHQRQTENEVCVGLKAGQWARLLLTRDIWRFTQSHFFLQIHTKFIYSYSISNCRSHIALHVESSYHPCLAKQLGFNCKYCHHSFWVPEKLNEHMFNRHSDKFERNFLMCSICAATFINKVSTCCSQLRRTSNAWLVHNTIVGFCSLDMPSPASRYQASGRCWIHHIFVPMQNMLHNSRRPGWHSYAYGWNASRTSIELLCRTPVSSVCGWKRVFPNALGSIS